MDLSRFRSGFFESNTRHQGDRIWQRYISRAFKRDAVRIATSSKDQKTIRWIVFPEDGLTRRPVASDLGIGFSTLNKWVKAVADEAGPPDPDQNLLRENERLRRENRILKDLSRARKQSGFEQKPFDPGDQMACEWFSRRMCELLKKATHTNGPID